MMKLNSWTSILERQPTDDGVYYIYLSSNQFGAEIRKVNYENGWWKIELDEYESIIAWKGIPPENIKHKEVWLLNHKKEIEDAFHLKKMKIDNFEIAETLVECICEYSWFMTSGFV